MSVCAQFIDGVLTETSTPVSDCTTGLILLSHDEYLQNLNLLTLFSIPAEPSQLLQLFSAGFFICVFAYLNGWLVGVLLNFIGKDH